MSKPVAPCKTCEDRKVGCHTSCENYKAYVIERENWCHLVKENKEKSKEIKVGKWYR